MLLSCLIFSLIFIKNVFFPCHKTLNVSGKVLWILFSSLTLDKELNAGDVIQANSGWEQGFEIGKWNLQQREFISPFFFSPKSEHSLAVKGIKLICEYAIIHGDKQLICWSHRIYLGTK